VSRDHIYLIPDEENAPIRGLKDWQSIMGTAEDVEKWRWPSLTKGESRKQVAIVSRPLQHHLESRANCLHVRLRVGGALAELPPAVPRLRPALRRAPRHPLRRLRARDEGVPAGRVPAADPAAPHHAAADRAAGHGHAVEAARRRGMRPSAAECDLGSVKEILCGAALLGRHLHDEREQRFGVRITQAGACRRRRAGCAPCRRRKPC
jgi:hypothetical protein